MKKLLLTAALLLPACVRPLNFTTHPGEHIPDSVEQAITSPPKKTGPFFLDHKTTGRLCQNIRASQSVKDALYKVYFNYDGRVCHVIPAKFDAPSIFKDINKLARQTAETGTECHIYISDNQEPQSRISLACNHQANKQAQNCTTTINSYRIEHTPHSGPTTRYYIARYWCSQPETRAFTER